MHAAGSSIGSCVTVTSHPMAPGILYSAAYELRQGTRCTRAQLPAADPAHEEGACRAAIGPGAEGGGHRSRRGEGLPGVLAPDRARAPVARRRAEGIHLLHAQEVIRPRDFRVDEDAKVRLERWPTRIEPYYRSREEYEQLLAEHHGELRELQDKHYAFNRYALLVIFQGMDTAGKDGAIKHVMSGLNPQGCQGVSFKQPSTAELEHDFLWRAALALPARGRIGIFNRSYYEEVLIVRVHPEILAKEDLPEALVADDGIWEGRYRSIRQFERHLQRNGTSIVKFFLHLSNEEQRQRFLARIDDAEKNWKFSLADIEERNYWPQYMKAYEACLAATSTRHAPWYVVPADDKRNARLIVSAIILDALQRLEVRYPKVTPERKRELRAIRRKLV